MRTKTILYTLLALQMMAIPSNALAQEQKKSSNSIYGGYGNIRFANLKDKTDSRYDYPYNGFFIGWRHNIKPRKDIELFINVGAEFGWYFNRDSYKSYQETLEYTEIDESNPSNQKDIRLEMYQNDYKRKMNFCGIKIPLDISYNFKVNGTKLAFRPFCGIHAGVLIYGHSHEEYTLDYEIYDSDTPTTPQIYTEPVSSSTNLLENSEEDYNQEALKRIYAGWHIGINVAYDKYSVGFTLENEMLHMSNYFSSRTLSANFAYTF